MSIDVTRNIIYRGYYLNDENIDANRTSGGGIGSGMSGCQVTMASISDIDVVQFSEKRSQTDGMDVGEVQKGMRRVRLAGTLYAKDRALLFDSLADLTAALDPVLAQREEPADKGYRPLYFSRPTNRVADYPTGLISLYINALPRAIDLTLFSKSQGGDDGDALAIPWQATLIARNPTLYSQTPVEIDLSLGSVAGTLANRGNFLTPVDLIVEVNSAAGSISGSVGDSIFTITIPASTGNRIIRFKGEDKILTVEESSVEVTRYDLISFQNATTWPLIDPGSSVYSITFAGVTPQAGSVMRYWERYS